MTDQAEGVPVSGTAALIQLLRLAISHLLHAHGQSEKVLSRVMQARMGTVSAGQPPVSAPDCFTVWKREIVLLPNDLELVKTAFEAICSSRLPEEFVLLGPVGRRRDTSAVLTRLCRTRQDAAVHTLLMAGFDELKNCLDDLERNLLLYETEKCSLQSALLDIESRFVTLRLSLESELELCTALKGLADQVHGSGKLR